MVSLCALLSVALLIGACAVYLGDYYRADTDALQAFANGSTVTQYVLDKNVTVITPEAPLAGFIFYPGGKVEHTAYLPLMQELAAHGVLCILVEMPFRLAVLDANAAEGLQAKFPEISHWYIGGHSLGGSMAASYLADHASQFAGLILLGSYSTADLSAEKLNVLSLYGSEDKVMNREKYQKYKSNLPKSTTEIVIEGGCHAYFGMYGAQDGDGTPRITNAEQILRTAEAIAQMIFGE